MPRTAEQAMARGVRLILEHFTSLDAKGPTAKPMAVQEVLAFLLVVENPGRTVNDLARLAGISPTSMSRYLLDLGERFRTGEPGRGLVDGKRNVLDMRETNYRLTGKGEAFMARLMDGPLAARKGGLP